MLAVHGEGGGMRGRDFGKSSGKGMRGGDFGKSSAWREMKKGGL